MIESMIELLKAILFGIVEGITEWLPVSSTGHMIILDEFIRLDCTPEFLEMFLVVIQLGAIMAVVILFWNKIFPFQRKSSRPPSSCPCAGGTCTPGTAPVSSSSCFRESLRKTASVWRSVSPVCLRK